MLESAGARGELMRTRSAAFLAPLLFVLTIPAVAAAQTFDLGGHVSFVSSGEFDDTSIGVGGRVAWYPSSWLGAEAEFTVYPGDFPGDVPAISSSQTEGLFGVTVGPRLGWVRPFVRFRPGFLAMAEAPRPFACILIFPQPLACRLAVGETLPVMDLGGGIQFGSRGVFLRVDVGDRMVRYPGPVFDGDRQLRDEDFWGHDFRLAVGAGFGF
jgi:hypothetical protein